MSESVRTFRELAAEIDRATIPHTHLIDPGHAPVTWTSKVRDRVSEVLTGHQQPLRPIVLHSLLHRACREFTWGAGAVWALVDAGADPNLQVPVTPRDKRAPGSAVHRLPVLSALSQLRECPEAIAALVEAGADIEAVDDKQGWTPLHWACAKMDRDYGGAAALIAAGANIWVSDKWGRTPLHLAAHSGAFQSLCALVKAGADIEARDEEGRTPLFLAAEYGPPDGVEYLIAHGAQVNIHANSGCTPLHLAGYSARLYTGESRTAANTRALIAAGADIYAVDVLDRTPLHWAAGGDSLARVQVLIEAGANVNAVDTAGMRAGECPRPLHSDIRAYFRSLWLQDEMSQENGAPGPGSGMNSPSL